jgi:hypothetical protein
VTLGRTVRTAALIAALSVLLSALGAELFYLHWQHEVAASGEGDLLHTRPESLDSEIRAALPPGTPEAAVEAVLRDHHIAFRYDAPKHVIRAEARKLMGSSPFAETGLYLWFFLDQNAALQRVQSRVTHSRARAPFRIE